MLETLLSAQATLLTLLSERREVAVFAALVIGYAAGAIKVGPFKLGTRWTWQ